jgi:transposase
VAFVVRLDAAGQDAENLLSFLQALGQPASGATGGLAPFALTRSCGDPQRTKNYRAAVFGSQKSAPVEARAAARFARTERPASDSPLSAQLRVLRQVAGRLQALVRQPTRLINQCHHLLALTFPELALLTKDRAAGWVLELVHRYPTAPCLARATAADRAASAYLPKALAAPLLDHARTAVASRDGTAAEELVRDQVRQLRDGDARQKRLQSLLVAAYQALPRPNHLDSIPGIGAVTAAVLTAFLLASDRCATPAKLVAYFGGLPIEAASGVNRDGQPRGPRRWLMSRRGTDLVRRYLWMAALSAIRFNPAVRALSARVVAKHPGQKAVAVGHAMRKLLHLVFAIWKGGRPFQPDHYSWQTPAQVAGAGGGTPHESTGTDHSLAVEDQVAGHTPDIGPARPVVTATCTDSVAEPAGAGEGGDVDFGHLKRQLPLARVLDQLGLSGRLRGRGPQRRGPCPRHRGDARGRTFSVNLDDNVFPCCDRKCGRKGDVIDLWAAVRGLSRRAAALDLVHTFGLEPAPPPGTETRNG